MTSSAWLGPDKVTILIKLSPNTSLTISLAVINEPFSISPSITAFFLGADYIERHITLDRAKWGTDQSASLEDVGMERLTTLIRKIPHTLGDGRKNFLDEEKTVSKKMRYWEYYN